MFDLYYQWASSTDAAHDRELADELERQESEAMPPEHVQIWLNELAEHNGRADIFDEHSDHA